MDLPSIYHEDSLQLDTLFEERRERTAGGTEKRRHLKGEWIFMPLTVASVDNVTGCWVANQFYDCKTIAKIVKADDITEPQMPAMRENSYRERVLAGESGRASARVRGRERTGA